MIRNGLRGGSAALRAGRRDPTARGRGQVILARGAEHPPKQLAPPTPTQGRPERRGHEHGRECRQHVRGVVHQPGIGGCGPLGHHQHAGLCCELDRWKRHLAVQTGGQRDPRSFGEASLCRRRWLRLLHGRSGAVFYRSPPCGSCDCGRGWSISTTLTRKPCRAKKRRASSLKAPVWSRICATPIARKRSTASCTSAEA